MKLRTKRGWPVTTFRNRPVVNFFRYLIHTNIRQTWKHRNYVPQTTSSENECCAPAEKGGAA